MLKFWKLVVNCIIISWNMKRMALSHWIVERDSLILLPEQMYEASREPVALDVMIGKESKGFQDNVDKIDDRPPINSRTAENIFWRTLLLHLKKNKRWTSISTNKLVWKRGWWMESPWQSICNTQKVSGLANENVWNNQLMPWWPTSASITIVVCPKLHLHLDHRCL